jgi:hypothetical protein
MRRGRFSMRSPIGTRRDFIEEIKDSQKKYRGK